jgi:DNA polymerase-3 subunit delta
MADAVHAFDYLSDPSRYAAPSVCVVFGDERFLKRLVLRQLQSAVLGEEQSEVPSVQLEGDQQIWRDVLDELSTVSLFGPDRRLVVVSEADNFVRQYRPELEHYVAQPKSTSVLVLDVASWPGTTRLYQAVARQGLAIECRLPERSVGKRKALDETRLAGWLSQWALDRHQVKLEARQAHQLLDWVGTDLGQLDQELAKLALFVGREGEITSETIRDVAGSWRTRTTWEMLGAAADGNAAEALYQLDRLLRAGEHPIAILGPASWWFRRFAAATRIVEQAQRRGDSPSLEDALIQAGFRRYPRDELERAQRQLRQLGRERAGRLYRWLLETDLALKSTHSTPHRARLALEQLVVRLARPPDASA